MTKELFIQFSGKILDSLGIQMYQSPTAAIAELISNAWDADCEEVKVILPDHLVTEAAIIISDNGNGMSFIECQNRYLKVGANRRDDDGDDKSHLKKRPVLGRKGIGKFAGFGIADIIEIDTISRDSGERTVFEMNLSTLKGADYITTEKKSIKVISYEPDGTYTGDKDFGTKVTLKMLKMKRTPSASAMRSSMLRRFLIHHNATDFKIFINDVPLPINDDELMSEFSFPSDYKPEEIPEGVVVTNDGWGIEALGDGSGIKWKFTFTKVPIDHEELRGVSIFCRGKVAQESFIFNLAGGLNGQHGLEYLSGQVQADFIDAGENDAITTERQRINWEIPETSNLLEWGQDRIKKLLAIWKARRGEGRVQKYFEKTSIFSERLDALKRHERNVIEGAIKKLATVPTLSQDRFEDLTNSLLTSWEGGRLKDLITDLSHMESMDEASLLDTLIDAKTLTALQMAEAINTKISIIKGLQLRVKTEELENAVRDYIAKNPWLISQQWETYRVEFGVKNLIKEVTDEVGITKDQEWKGRIDLVLSSGRHLLILEFMRPGLTINKDHIDRYEGYIDALRGRLKANTGSDFDMVTGLLVADKIHTKDTVQTKIGRMAKEDMKVIDWTTLLVDAGKQLGDFQEMLHERAPDEPRLKRK